MNRSVTGAKHAECVAAHTLPGLLARPVRTISKIANRPGTARLVLASGLSTICACYQNVTIAERELLKMVRTLRTAETSRQSAPVTTKETRLHAVFVVALNDATGWVTGRAGRRVGLVGNMSIHMPI